MSFESESGVMVMIIPKRLLKSEKIPLLPFPSGRRIKCSWNPIQSNARSLLNYGKCKEKQPLWELFAFFVTSLYSLDGASVPRKNFQYYAKPAVSPCCLMFTPYQNLLFLPFQILLQIGQNSGLLICIDLFKKSGIYSSDFYKES